MILGETTGAASLFVDLMRHDGDFLVRRFALGVQWSERTGRDIEVIVIVGIHQNESCLSIHL